MSFSFSRLRVSSNVKVVMPVVAILVLLLASTTWLAYSRMRDQVYRGAGFGVARNGYQRIQERRATELLSKYHTIINEPRFRAATKASRFATLQDFASGFVHEAVSNNEATVAAFTFNKDGRQQAITASAEGQLDTDEFVARALESVRLATEGRAGLDTVRVGNELFHLISFPVPLGDTPAAGVMTLGMKLGVSDAKEIQQMTGSEVVFLTDGQVSASSLTKASLTPALITHFNELCSQEPVQDPKLAPEIILGKEHYLAQPGRFGSLSGDHNMGYLLLSPYGAALADFQQTQHILFAASALILVLSTAIVWILVRRITLPLRKLRNDVKAVGQGDFTRRAEVASQEECGELASAINQMIETVNTSREELEKTVQTLKATQNQLIQSEKLSGIGEFVSGVAHELNNPLTSVMGFSELLQQSEMPEQQRRYLDVIFKSSKRCQKIVQSLLSFARRHAPERKVICVNAIVESAVEILQYQMRTSNIEVFTQLDPRLPASEVDSHQMQQVFLNIISNARQAIEAHQTKGWLRISTEFAEGCVRVVFQDNGPGIAVENLKKIFNPFFTTKEVGKGTGLGLSLCYGIISEHGGTITPHSGPGEGATFVIELPVAQATPRQAEQVATPAPTPAAPDGAGKRVLVIDDEDAILQMIREALTRNGYKVDIAHDGESALRRLGQYHYDLALCDWKMPGLNGQQVYERLHALNPEMSRRLIFITGDVVNPNTQDFLRTKDKVCLSKPFTLGEFRSAISRVISPK